VSGINRTDGARLSTGRAVARTVLTFIPWELAHTLIWQIRFVPAMPSLLITSGFVLVWMLVGANVASLALSKTHESLADRLAGTYVISSRPQPD
jgi:Zn-dependent protease with chaperone function